MSPSWERFPTIFQMSGGGVEGWNQGRRGLRGTHIRGLRSDRLSQEKKIEQEKLPKTRQRPSPPSKSPHTISRIPPNNQGGVGKRNVSGPRLSHIIFRTAGCVLGRLSRMPSMQYYGRLPHTNRFVTKKESLMERRHQQRLAPST